MEPTFIWVDIDGEPAKVREHHWKANPDEVTEWVRETRRQFMKPNRKKSSPKVG